MADVRALRLKTLYDDVIKGEKSLTVNNSKLFLEALCLQTPAVTIIPNLVGSSHGLEALLLALSSDTSPPFLNGQLTSFLEYIRASDLLLICGGGVVRQVLSKLVEAPRTWESFVKAARERTLDQRALSAFAWLLIQLLSLPIEEAVTHLAVAQDPAIQKALVDSSSYDIRVQGQRIVHIAETVAGGSTSKHTNATLGLGGPGGRHDNDFADIQRISIHPTADELRTLDVYLPRACDVQDQAQDPDGLAIHIDSQFRLLREDMLREFREELAVSAQRKRKGRKPIEIYNLVVYGIHCDNRLAWSLLLVCRGGLPPFRGLKTKERKKFLRDHPRFLRHGFLVCLFVDDEFVTFGTLVREEELLIKPPNLICIQLPDTNVRKVLMQLKSARFGIRLLQIDTAMFSYEPVLKQLKKAKELLLAPELVSWQEGALISRPAYPVRVSLKELLKNLADDFSCNLQSCLGLMKPTHLDEAQAECFRAAFQQRVVLIQGPPGTGKSFIGSLISKAIHQLSREKILVVCYTHHALDDFLGGLLDLGIPEGAIVRLGSAEKATAHTQSLALSNQKKGDISKRTLQVIDRKKQTAEEQSSHLRNMFFQVIKFKACPREFLEFLEFSESWYDDSSLCGALQVPEDADGMRRVDRRGKTVDKYYLVQRWVRGEDAGIFKAEIPEEHQSVWRLPPDIRNKKYQQWCNDMIEEELVRIQEVGASYNRTIKEIDALFSETDISAIKGKRIIACTTTAAAKYSQIIRSISPGVVLVEEAGEILESHVLTALGPETKHLILIGDHKQLRPKVNYELSVEKGTGYDLNRSLFERLILKGFPHQTLFSQHRMRPEISALVREMTYPELKDAKETQERPDLRGFTDNIIFVNHKEPESELSGGHELGDSRAYSSKQNLFEAKMTLRCIRYLSQHGYSTDDIVVLTPYLGQLRLLHDELRVDNDLVLNDRDTHDLVRAGFMPEETEEECKPHLRISTIDNFQGEEANIVVASLTRSNTDNKIGWMSAPERLNVLISRARNGIIMIGNAEHFVGSRTGGELWKRFFGLLKAGKHIYDGFPVRCERHPNRQATLKEPANFDTECPDGGCDEACNRILSCGIHKCSRRCHPKAGFLRHSRIKCEVLVPVICLKGHSFKCKCHAKSSVDCETCKREEEKAQEELRKKLEAQEEEEKEHALKMAELDSQIESVSTEAAEQCANAPEQEGTVGQAETSAAMESSALVSHKKPRSETDDDGCAADNLSEAVKVPAADIHRPVNRRQKKQKGGHQSTSSTSSALNEENEPTAEPLFSVKKLAEETVSSKLLTYVDSGLKKAGKHTPKQLHTPKRLTNQAAHSQPRPFRGNTLTRGKQTTKPLCPSRMFSGPTPSFTPRSYRGRGRASSRGGGQAAEHVPPTKFGFPRTAQFQPNPLVRQASMSGSISIPDLRAPSPPGRKAPPRRTKPLSLVMKEFAAKQTVPGNRDTAVPDQVWEELLQDVENQNEREKQAQAKVQRQEQALLQAIIAEKENLTQIRTLECEQQYLFHLSQEGHHVEPQIRCVKEELEQARARVMQLKRARESEGIRLETLRKAELFKHKREQEVQQKLRNLGRCIDQYRWVKQSGGFRCAGGTHFVENGVL